MENLSHILQELCLSCDKLADDDGGEEDEDDSEEDALQRCAFKRLEAASPQCKANCTSTGPCFLKFVLLYEHVGTY